MQLPIDADAATRLPTERDGALVTVLLPGSPERPRPNFASAILPLDARGRLTITVGVRREAGIPNGADVLAVVDPAGARSHTLGPTLRSPHCVPQRPWEGTAPLPFPQFPPSPGGIGAQSAPTWSGRSDQRCADLRSCLGR
jgi:hypothetical protein